MRNAFAIIMAGGNGERFWPVSTPERPKQFVELFGGKALIRHAFDRLQGLFPPERILVITASRLVSRTRRVLPELAAENVIGEPCRRDTASAVATAVGLVMRRGGPDAVGCILAADHLMTPVSAFQATLRDSIRAARKTGAIVTMGIQPTYPATGFGYIACGEAVDCGTQTMFNSVKRFVEKPNETMARRYLRSGSFRWNAGLFIWTAEVMRRDFAADAPDFLPLIDLVAARERPGSVIRRLYPEMRSISIDFAVMEKTRNILVAKCPFAWDDVGSWRAIADHFPADGKGNTCLGRTALEEASGCVIVSDEAHLTAVVGLDNIVVVHTPHATLVCAKDRVQELRKLVRNLPPRLPARKD